MGAAGIFWGQRGYNSDSVNIMGTAGILWGQREYYGDSGDILVTERGYYCDNLGSMTGM